MIRQRVIILCILVLSAACLGNGEGTSTTQTPPVTTSPTTSAPVTQPPATTKSPAPAIMTPTTIPPATEPPQTTAAPEPEIPDQEPTRIADDQTLTRDFKLPVPLFASSSAWNQKVTGANVLPESDEQILVTYRVLLGDTSTLSPGSTSPNWVFMDVSYDEWTVPVFRMGETKQTVTLCNYDGELDWTNPKVLPDSWMEAGGPVTIPTPAGPVRPSGPQGTYSDGHLVLYDPDTYIEYDFWQATTVRDGNCKSRGGGYVGTSILEVGNIDFFNVRGPGANPSGNEYSSARASGVPLLAGMILPEDIEAGEINHALAIAIPAPRKINIDLVEGIDYFYPASRAEETYYNTNPHALAQGQRIRMKQKIVLLDDEDEPVYDGEDQLAPITRMFLTALRTYGAYVVDNAEGFSFTAEDIHTANLDLSDDEVNRLIGNPPGTPLPAGKTKWQILMEKLNDDDQLGRIPIAYGPWQEGQDPKTATITVSNFEVVEPAAKP